MPLHWMNNATGWWDVTAGFSSGVPFAVDANGAWRDVDAVERGKACGCYCAECSGPLVARQGDVRVHHFAHEDRRECRMALEASLFGMAIAILKAPGAWLCLPPAYSRHSLATEIGATENEVALAFRELSMEPSSTVMVMVNPVLSCSKIIDTRPDAPEIRDSGNDFALHFLSSRKTLRVLENESASEPGNILALNPLVFALSWQSVCDPDTEERDAQHRAR